MVFTTTLSLPTGDVCNILIAKLVYTRKLQWGHVPQCPIAGDANAYNYENIIHNNHTRKTMSINAHWQHMHQSNNWNSDNPGCYRIYCD